MNKTFASLALALCACVALAAPPAAAEKSAAPLSVKISNAVSITFGHLVSYYGSDYVLVPVEGFDKSLDIVVAWRKSAEKPFFEDFARIVKEVIDEFGY